MFDKFSEAAEKLASNVSRRAFLGSLGRFAGAAALATAGVLTTAGAARAGAGVTCCHYYNAAGYFCAATQCVRGACPPGYGTCQPRATAVRSCAQCI
jgi:hypothetical protein